MSELKVNEDGVAETSVASLGTTEKTTLPIGSELKTTVNVSEFEFPLASDRAVAFSLTVNPAGTVVKLSNSELTLCRSASLATLLLKP